MSVESASTPHHGHCFTRAGGMALPGARYLGLWSARTVPGPGRHAQEPPPDYRRPLFEEAETPRGAVARMVATQTAGSKASKSTATTSRSDMTPSTSP